MTSNNTTHYLSLLKHFLIRELSAEEFQAMFLDMFKRETQQLDPASFSILDTLFGDIDSFVPNSSLRIDLESQNPGFYLDEMTLRRKVSDAYERLVASV